MYKITFERFNAIFEETERLPKNKKEYMQKLYEFYNYGRQNQTDEFKNKLLKLFDI